MGVKVLTVIGTRPEAIKLFPLIHALEADPRFESRVCVTGQHREMVDQVLELAGVRPDHHLSVMQVGPSLGHLTAAILIEIDAVLDLERPDWVLVQGDTCTALAAGLAAHYRRIRVCHIEAGLRSGDPDQPFPEETHRRAISTFATLHCAPTKAAVRALAKEGVAAKTVHLTGNTGVDALDWALRCLAQDPSLHPVASALEARAAGKKLILVTMHRRENIGPPLASVCAAVRYIARRNDVAVVIPMHANPAIRETLREQFGAVPGVELTDALRLPDFLRLLSVSHFVVTDSGGVQEEAPALGVPVLVARTVTERGEGVAGGTVRLVGTDTEAMVAEMTRLLDDPRWHARMARPHRHYGDGRAAQRIVERLA